MTAPRGPLQKWRRAQVAAEQGCLNGQGGDRAGEGGPPVGPVKVIAGQPAHAVPLLTARIR